MTARLALAVLFAATLSGGVVHAQSGPLADPIPQPIPMSAIQVKLDPVASGFTSPIDLTVPPSRDGHDDDEGDGDEPPRDGRAFVVDQTGLVLILKNGVVQPKPFLDLTGVISQLGPAFGRGPLGLNPGYDERGLLGLAFHPGFHDPESPGYQTLYTLHNVPNGRAADFPQPPFPPTAVPNCQEVVAEWKVSRTNPDAVDPASYRELLRFDKPEFNHNGGTVAFGRDGLLYAAFGDGGAANDVGNGHIPGVGNAQSLGVVLGKMIRIDPLVPRLTSREDGLVSANGMYRIPHDNPFVSTPGALGEIYAYGFRNPYRFSFDAKNGRLVLADVGQNNIEEVDVVRRGGDYGWHFKEGTFLFDPATGNVFNGPDPVPGLIDPVAEYDHFEATAGKITRIAIVGGFVYRGSAIPALRGKFICADLNGFLFDVDLATGRIEQLLNPSLFIKGFGQDADDEICVLGSTILGPSGAKGVVLRLAPVVAGGGGDGDDGD
jgi:hypothetical protein